MGILGADQNQAEGNTEQGQQDQDVDFGEYAKQIQGNVPDQMKKAYTSIVVAGMKFLFSDETQGMIDEYLAQPGPISKKLGDGISALMVMLTREAKGAMAPELVIPAGIELVIQAAKYVTDSGVAKVSAKDLGDAIQTFIYDVLEKNGVSPEQFDEFIDKHDKGQGDMGGQDTDQDGDTAGDNDSDVTGAQNG